MRAVATVIAALAVSALASQALARPWTDPNGRITMDLPQSWDVSENNCPECTYLLVFNPSRDCHVVARPRTGSNVLQAHRVRVIMRENDRITPEVWTGGANAIPALFPNDSAQFVSQTLDQSGFWPIQRAELRSGDKTVHAAFQMRQDMELWAFCVTASGPHSAADYDALFRSMGTPNDARLRGEVEAAEAAEQQPAAAQPQPEEGKQEGRRRDD